MEFKVFLLCFAFVVVATSAASVCKCGAEKKDPVSKYKVTVKDGDKKVEQEVDIDTEKDTETIRVPKTDSSNAGEVDIVYDFKRNLTMHRLSAAKACFLSEGTEDQPKPADLKNVLDTKNIKDDGQSGNTTNNDYQVGSTVNDRSNLSDEMASMCAKLPIYRIKKTTSQRVKRQSHCPYGFYYVRFCHVRCCIWDGYSYRYYRYCHWHIYCY